MTTIDPTQPLSGASLEQQIQDEASQGKTERVGKGQVAGNQGTATPPVKDLHPGTSTQPMLAAPSKDPATTPTPTNVTNAEQLISQNGVDLSAVENLLIKNNLQSFQMAESAGLAQLDQQIEDLDKAADELKTQASDEMAKTLTGMFTQIAETALMVGIAAVSIAAMQPEGLAADAALETGLDAGLEAGGDALGDGAGADIQMAEIPGNDDVDPDMNDDLDEEEDLDDDEDSVDDSDDSEDDIESEMEEDMDDEDDVEDDDDSEEDVKEKEEEKLEKAKEEEAKEKEKAEDADEDDKAKQKRARKIQTAKRIAALTAAQGLVKVIGMGINIPLDQAIYDSKAAMQKDQADAARESMVSQKMENHANQSLQSMQQALSTMDQVAKNQATAINKIFS